MRRSFFKQSIALLLLVGFLLQSCYNPPIGLDKKEYIPQSANSATINPPAPTLSPVATSSLPMNVASGYQANNLPIPSTGIHLPENSQQPAPKQTEEKSKIKEKVTVNLKSGKEEKSKIEEAMEGTLISLINGIKQLFQELDELIQQYLSDQQQIYKNKVNHKLQEINKLIGLLEGEDDAKFNQFKVLYYQKYSSYLKVIGEDQKAATQDKLLEKYKKALKENSKETENLNAAQKNSNSKLFEKLNFGKFPSENQQLPDLSQLFIVEDLTQAKMHQAAEGVIDQIKKLKAVEELALEKIKEILQQINQGAIHNFIDYSQFNTYQASIINLIDGLLLDLHNQDHSQETSQKKPKSITATNKEDLDELVKCLEHLKLIANCIVYQTRVAFMRKVLASPQPELLLFDQVLLLTRENITKRYKELSLSFHHDKTQNWLLDKDKPIGRDLSALINQLKDKLIQKLQYKAGQIGSEFSFYQTKGDDFWKLTIDYQNASKKEWNKLKVLQKEEVEHFTPQELTDFKIYYSKLAYEEFRACCKIADQAKDIKNQISYRQNMALCLYLANQFLEAQLYALAAIQLVFNHSNQINEQELARAKDVLRKVQGMRSEATANQAPARENQNNNNSSDLIIINNQAVSLQANSSYSFGEQRKIQHNIHQELANLAQEMIIKSDGALVKYKTSQEEILKARRRGRAHQARGIMTILGGIGTGSVAVVAAVADVVGTIGAASAAGTGVAALGIGAVAAPVIGIASGVALFGFGIWFGYKVWQKGNTILEEPKIREKLNDIMEQALRHYEKGDYNQFIQALSQEYVQGSRIFILKQPGDTINSEEIIKCLISHGFRPDGIAYLLNLIGEVLSSGKIQIANFTQTDLTERAKDALHGVLKKTLQQEASQLDKRITEIRQKNYTKQYLHLFSDLIFIRDYSAIAQEHLDDAQQMPFHARLEEMRNIARMNLAIIRIIKGGLDNEEFEFAKKLIQEVRFSFDNNYQFVSTAKTRLETLEDFLWVVSGQPVADENLTPLMLSFSLPSTSNKNASEPYINYLNDLLTKTTSKEEKIKIYNQKAAYYAQQAKKFHKFNRLQSLCCWQYAQKNYQESLQLFPEDADAVLGLANCLIRLCKYSQALDVLKQHSQLATTSAYWVLGSLAYLKKNNYKKAEAFIVEALKKAPHDREADQIRKLVKKLQQADIRQNLKLYQSPNMRAEENNFKTRQSDNQPFYKILSIDGGGIRGIIPALWLSEIERRTRKPIAHSFNMLSGTSTGAIIAAGLSTPHIVETRQEPKTVAIPPAGNFAIMYFPVEIPCSYRPRYTAYTIMELYTQKASQIFTETTKSLFRPASLLGNYTTSKYTAEGRLSTCKEYFGSAQLSHSLTDLVIPAVSEENLTHTHLFNKYDSKQDVHQDESMLNVLMATTAAPTFFPPHTIPNKGIFVDGGVQLNNPAFSAYTEALRYKIPKDKIFVLSMGTGNYIPDPLQPDLDRGKLFWAQNLHKVALPAQEGNSDIHMHQHLGNRYQRWQAWLEDPITLDDYAPENINTLLEIAQQHLEELYDSEDNTMNKLLEFLEKDDTKDLFK